MKTTKRIGSLVLASALVITSLLGSKPVSAKVSAKHPWDCASSVTVKIGKTKQVSTKLYWKGSTHPDMSCWKVKKVGQTNKKNAKVTINSEGEIRVNGLKSGKSTVTVRFTGRVVTRKWAKDMVHHTDTYGPKVSYTKKIKIKIKEADAPKLNTKKITLDLGSGKSVTRKVTPADNVKRISVTPSDSDIVYVSRKKSSFTVSAAAEGECTLKVSVELKTKVKGKMEYNYTIPVTVTKATEEESEEDEEE